MLKFRAKIRQGASKTHVITIPAAFMKSELFAKGDEVEVSLEKR